jgi:hypothetical protein
MALQGEGGKERFALTQRHKQGIDFRIVGGNIGGGDLGFD